MKPMCQGIPLILVLLLLSCKSAEIVSGNSLADELDRSIQTEMLNKWYPACLDTTYGGFISTFTYDWKPEGDQDKMIVTQARHTWINAKASEFYPQTSHYKKGARHGFLFLHDVMWDKAYGGFYTLVSRDGEVKDDSKTAYGNSFGIYALAAYYKASGDTSALKLAREAFMWLEKNSHDPVHKGYFQHLTREGKRIERTSDVPSTSDIGYKDQNSSIHLLEAFTELYQVSPDSLLRVRLEEMLELIRDTIVTEKGYMNLFFKPDWTPVSFRDSSVASIMAHRYLDHVSFGHDVEVAYLMLEACHVLGREDDTTTLNIAKRIVDHSLDAGWDEKVGGFYDEGYYFKGKESIKITKDSKSWWAQAEGLNTLLIMAKLFTNDERNYFQKFRKQWTYINKYVIDHQHGDWYAGGLDKEPEQAKALKGQIWKASYHQYRALSNCVSLLRNHFTN